MGNAQHKNDSTVSRLAGDDCVIERPGETRFLAQRAEHYDGFVDDLNHYLQSRYNFKTKPVLEPFSERSPIEVRRAAVKLFLRFQPGYRQYTRYSLVVVDAYFRDNKQGETDAFFKFLLDQSEQRDILEIYLEPYSGVHKGVVRSYKLNKAEGWHGWQISCDDLKRTMG